MPTVLPVETLWVNRTWRLFSICRPISQSDAWLSSTISRSS
jgi:hypothetical protein